MLIDYRCDRRVLRSPAGWCSSGSRCSRARSGARRVGAAGSPPHGLMGAPGALGSRCRASCQLPGHLLRQLSPGRRTSRAGDADGSGRRAVVATAIVLAPRISKSNHERAAEQRREERQTLASERARAAGRAAAALRAASAAGTGADRRRRGARSRATPGPGTRPASWRRRRSARDCQTLRPRRRARDLARLHGGHERRGRRSAANGGVTSATRTRRRSRRHAALRAAARRAAEPGRRVASPDQRPPSRCRRPCRQLVSVAQRAFELRLPERVAELPQLGAGTARWPVVTIGAMLAVEQLHRERRAPARTPAGAARGRAPWTAPCWSPARARSR